MFFRLVKFLKFKIWIFEVFLKTKKKLKFRLLRLLVFFIKK